MAKDIVLEERPPERKTDNDISFTDALRFDVENMLTLNLSDQALFKLLRYFKFKEAIQGEEAITQSPADMLAMHILKGVKLRKTNVCILASHLGINNDVDRAALAFQRKFDKRA